MEKENFCNGECSNCEKFIKWQKRTESGRSIESEREEELNKLVRDLKMEKDKEEKEYKKKKPRK